MDPFSDVWVSSFPTALVAETWSESGHEIHTMRCDGVLGSFCISMSAKGLSSLSPRSDLDECCSSCRKRRNILQKNFTFVEHVIEDFLSSDVIEKVESIIESISRNNWKDFNLESLPVGRIAAYELILERKLASIDRVILYWDDYQQRLRSTLLSYFAAKNLIKAQQIEAVVAYNGLYSVNRVVLLYANSIGIQAWAIAAGSHQENKFSKISLYRFDSLPVHAMKSKEWEKARHIPLAAEQVASVKRHFLQLQKAKSNFVYSTPKRGVHPDELCAKLNIPKNKKIILVTMSSPDEFIALEAINFLAPKKDDVFKSVNDWITFLIQFMESRNDCHLIIRVHPRQFPNKREKIKSENAAILENTLSKTFPNVSINWPTDQISIYDLATITDLVLNRTSSAGIELSALGVPTLLCDSENMLSYDPTINVNAKSKLEYEVGIDRLLTSGRSVEHALGAFRFLSFMFSQVNIDISEGFSYPSSGYLSRNENFLSKFYNKVLIRAQHQFQFIERSSIRAKKKLSKGPLLSSVFDMSGDVLIGDFTEQRLTEDQEKLEIQKAIIEITDYA